MKKTNAKRTRYIKRAGTTKAMAVPIYPKRYTVEVTPNETGDGSLITRECIGLSAWELYGLLQLCLLEIERQMRIKPDETLNVD